MTVLLCLSFLLLGSLSFIQQSIAIFIVITLGLCSLTAFFLHASFAKRVERLNNDLVDVHSGISKSQKVSVLGHDELSEIASRINVLLETVKLSRQQLFLLSEKSNGSAEVSLVSNPKKQNLMISGEHHENTTELPNRVHFNEALNKSISYAKRHNKIAAVLVLDVEIIEGVSMVRSELTANAIKEIVKNFSRVLRNEDMLAKLDGNEFIILLHDIGKPKFASAVAEKLLLAISSGVYVDYKGLILKANIGVCICPNEASTLEEVIEKTYTALYRAKSMAGNNYQFYTKELDAEAHHYINMKSDLQKAIKNNELILHYQPKMNIKKGSTVGVEVLIRWMHPTLGLLTPDKFLDVAEDSGSIIPIGEWALREACKVNMHWQSEGYEHLTVAMNLSTKQFYHPGLLNTLTSILNDTKLNPNYLELEINEETIMRDLEKTAKIMQNIFDLGVQISIDHFGKGYTSISHLKHLPVSTIKIDRGFISGVPLNPNDSAITSAIIALAHYLGIAALAEGVENVEQLQYLSQQNCDMVQGYFLSYPLPIETVTQHFRKISDRAIS